MLIGRDEFFSDIQHFSNAMMSFKLIAFKNMHSFSLLVTNHVYSIDRSQKHDVFSLVCFCPVQADIGLKCTNQLELWLHSCI